MSCEEACRIILSSDNYGNFITVGELDEDPELCELDTVALRERIYAILSNSALPYTVRRNEISRIFGTAELDDTEAIELIASLEYLDENHKKLFLEYSSDVSTPQKHEKALERALAYFIFRHCSEAVDENEYRATIGFCLFCAGISLPSLAMDVMELVGGLTTPLAMLLIGTRLYGVRLSDFKDMDYHICAFLRLIAIPLLLYGALTLLRVPLAVRSTMFLITAMPNSTMVVNQAELYGGDHVFAARAVAYTTLLSLLSVPVMSLLL
jgi:hypothetical protein